MLYKFEYKEKNGTTFISFIGSFSIKNIAHIQQEYKSVPISKKYIIDLSNVNSFDTACVILFIKIKRFLESRGSVEVVGYNSEQLELYNRLKDIKKSKVIHKQSNIFYNIGQATIGYWQFFLSFLNFIGEFSYKFFKSLIFIKKFRFKETIYHIYHSGFSASLIISVTMFLVGMVIAYQGSVQLAKFGADIFIVDTVGISITRELSPMVVAIIIAGRSGSSYTAEIGSMKLTQEIDAMKTMGFDVIDFLVIPRVVALIVSMPLLIFLGDIMGIAGGAFASYFELNISPTIFINRLYEALALKHYILGLIKAPFFAFTIAIIGCFRGFLVSNNTQSIGLQTTASVVNSIFVVIALDAIFSIIFTELGI